MSFTDKLQSTTLNNTGGGITPDESGKNMILTVLGTRGSMAVSAPGMARYGGNTTCYLIETPEEAIIIDAGTGIMNLPDVQGKRISLLITHAHIDHIMALPMFLGKQAGKEITIYGEMRDGLTIKEQLERYISNPLWPVTMDDYPVKLTFKDITTDNNAANNTDNTDNANSAINNSSFNIGDVTVSTMPSNHPGGSTIYRLDYNGESVVIATDFEHEEVTASDCSQSTAAGSPLAHLAAFSASATLILYDAQYTPEEYEKCRGYGHSTYVQAIELAEKLAAGDRGAFGDKVSCKESAEPTRILLIHHAPSHDDAFLDALQAEIDRTLSAKMVESGKAMTTGTGLSSDSTGANQPASLAQPMYAPFACPPQISLARESQTYIINKNIIL